MRSGNALVIGLMSGTSLDGLDLAACRFQLDNKWSFQLVQQKTIPYSELWRNRLSGAPKLSGLELSRLDLEYGRWMGEQVVEFLSEYDLHPDLISSHGHTVFHEPHKGLTLQIGKASSICSVVNLPVVADFRTLDVALGGQGAPLVPVGDALLFPEFQACLNLGGFANVSFEQDGKRRAFDVCPLNMPLNELASKLKLPYDLNGELAASGRVDPELLNRLNSLAYYHSVGPKSLGREWYQAEFAPLIDSDFHSIPDLLATIVRHQAIQIVESIPGSGPVLVTGGGAFNLHLMHQLESLAPGRWVIPDAEIISFKEALVFAFLGLLRWRGENNVWSEVTGARRNSCSGVLVGG